MAASGGQRKPLLASTDALPGYKPDFSIDGQRIVFGCALDRRTTEHLCVMNADGTGAEPIFSGTVWENHVVWD